MYDGKGKWAWVDGGWKELRPDPELRELSVAVDCFRDAPRVPRRPAELEYDLIQLRHLCDLLELEFARRAAAFAESDQAEMDGSASAGDWIRHNCKVSASTVEKALCVGRTSEKLSESVAAMERGATGFEHLELNAGTGRALSESGTSSGFCEGRCWASQWSTASAASVTTAPTHATRPMPSRRCAST